RDQSEHACSSSRRAVEKDRRDRLAHHTAYEVAEMTAEARWLDGYLPIGEAVLGGETGLVPGRDAPGSRLPVRAQVDDATKALRRQLRQVAIGRCVRDCEPVGEAVKYHVVLSSAVSGALDRVVAVAIHVDATKSAMLIP